jgi:hypothetical protein
MAVPHRADVRRVGHGEELGDPFGGGEGVLVSRPIATPARSASGMLASRTGGAPDSYRARASGSSLRLPPKTRTSGDSQSLASAAGRARLVPGECEGAEGEAR